MLLRLRYTKDNHYENKYEVKQKKHLIRFIQNIEQKNDETNNYYHYYFILKKCEERKIIIKDHIGRGIPELCYSRNISFFLLFKDLFK